MERGQAAVNPVQIANQPLQAGVQRILEQMPIQAGVMVPFALLAEFPAHEEQLLARMAEHEAVVGPQIGEFLPAIAGHPSQKRAFAMHDFVMAQGQNEVFAEGVKQAESESDNPARPRRQLD